MIRYAIQQLSLAAALLVAAGPAPVEAQTPDTTQWERYFPLAIGHEWQYEAVPAHPWNEDERGYASWEIVADTVIEARDYYIFEHRSFDKDQVPTGTWRRPIRHDSASAGVVVWERLSNGNFADLWFPSVPCGLDVLEGIFQCEPPGQVEYQVGSQAKAEVSIGSESVEVPWLKHYGTLGLGTSVAVDIGVVGWAPEGGDVQVHLRYAAVNGREYASPVISTAVTPEPSLPRGIALDVFPNPAQVGTQVRVALKTSRPEVYILVLYDLMGRRVQAPVAIRGPGSHELTLTLDGLAPGIYGLSVRSPELSVTRQIHLVR